MSADDLENFAASHMATCLCALLLIASLESSVDPDVTTAWSLH